MTTKDYGRVVLELHKMMHPENYPPGDPNHDPDHVYWQGECEHEPAFQWSSDTLDWIDEDVRRALADHPEARI